MHIYLKHSVHGTKVAISDGEAESDERNGWVRYDPHATEPEPEVSPEMPDFLTNNLKAKRKYQRKTDEV